MCEIFAIIGAFELHYITLRYSTLHYITLHYIHTYIHHAYVHTYMFRILIRYIQGILWGSSKFRTHPLVHDVDVLVYAMFAQLVTLHTIN